MVFLKPGATAQEIMEASFANHVEWFNEKALISGGVVHHEEGFCWQSAAEEVTVPFPEGTIIEKDLNDFVADLILECRNKGVNSASVWMLKSDDSVKLGAKLLSWGFEWGWKPHWMSMDFTRIPVDFALPVGVTVVIDDGSDSRAEGLPYYTPKDIENLNRISQKSPRRLWRFVVRFEGKVVGESVMLLTSGTSGVAGIYNVGVIPSMRKQGIATALMFELCRFAQSKGCHYATLNSAADGFYDKIGFDSLGWGQTWWMHKAQIDSAQPTPNQREFLEKLCSGDITGLNLLWDSRMGAEEKPASWDVLLQNGHTALANAVAAKQHNSVEWLIQKGAVLDILQAWELGWKERIPVILEANPEAINSPGGQWKITPLHQAVQRRDIELVKVLLQYQPELTIKDSEFNSTPLGWANHFGYHEISDLIEAYQLS